MKRLLLSVRRSVSAGASSLRKIAVSRLATVALVALGFGPALLAQTYTFTHITATWTPRGTAVDAQGNVYVTDQRSQWFQSLLTEWTSEEVAEFTAYLDRFGDALEASRARALTRAPATGAPTGAPRTSTDPQEN